MSLYLLRMYRLLAILGSRRRDNGQWRRLPRRRMPVCIILRCTQEVETSCIPESQSTGPCGGGFSNSQYQVPMCRCMATPTCDFKSSQASPFSRHAMLAFAGLQYLKLEKDAHLSPISPCPPPPRTEAWMNEVTVLELAHFPSRAIAASPIRSHLTSRCS